jgi:hypothetical protein
MKQRVFELLLLPKMPLLQVHMMAKLLSLVLELAHNMLPSVLLLSRGCQLVHFIRDTTFQSIYPLTNL